MMIEKQPTKINYLLYIGIFIFILPSIGTMIHINIPSFVSII